MAQYVYETMLNELHEKMIEMFGEELCEKVFDVPEVVDGDTDPTVEEFVQSLFEAFPRRQVLSEILRQGNFGYPFNGTWLMIPKEMVEKLDQ